MSPSHCFVTRAFYMVMESYIFAVQTVAEARNQPTHRRGAGGGAGYRIGRGSPSPARPLFERLPATSALAARPEFCTKLEFEFLCRRFGRFLLANSARNRVLRFYAEDLGGFCWRILHENEFCSFMQKFWAVWAGEFCTKMSFAVLCRKNMRFLRKKSA